MFSENFGEFSRESALGFVIPLFSAAAISSVDSLIRFWTAIGWGSHRTPDGALGRLGRVRAKNLVFERSSVETADDGLHFVRGRRFHERESLGFLRFVIPDNLNRIGDEVFRGEPLFNVVGGDPSGQIAQKDSKAHSVACVHSVVGIGW